VVETKKALARPSSDDVLETMSRETDAILARSRQLVKELEELLETSRQLRAAQTALLEQRQKYKDDK
jgi:prefoldin subunit 5